MIYVALFRGINVGGKNILPMNELRTAMESLGARGVQTYIQSGNAVFVSDEDDAGIWSKRIREAIRRAHGFEPQVMVLPLPELEQAIADNPFPEGQSDPKTLHLGFLLEPATATKLDKLDALKSASERYQMTDKVFYLHAPDGIGKSKLAVGAEKTIGVPMTMRNWNTVQKIRELA
ncbi:DUF1697 domain-containing protein [Cerasicoccus arenae]|uniref:DUF1697 domain-containing protein n=1 Tax=Cerasicoccus arenae TaxID=424488 RepID=A0A8J3GDR5_9BACT|nr:DUF1697 domain-containing protein [Cerasicoccus arenae]MBK1859660.1 DUF1697 domain-containing protein [Cerasicoccus arenae]GHC03899.1 hypothetical protein GCM10007047_20630 [Cerasicoccus arenae]